MYDVVYNEKHCIVRNHNDVVASGQKCIVCNNKTEILRILGMLRMNYSGIKVEILLNNL